MPKPLIRAFFFDLDDTVYSITDFAELARKSAIKAMINAGLQIDPDECYHEVCAVIEEFGSNHEHHFDKLLRRLPPETYRGKDPLIIRTAGTAAYHDAKPYNFFPFNDAIEVLREFDKRGLLLGIITSGLADKQTEKIVRLGLHNLVPHHRILITDLIGISKNNPALYERACKTANASPTECAYIGDNPAVDVDVPAQIGMITFLSRRGGKYKATDGKVEPKYIVDNFYDVLEIIDRDYETVPYKLKIEN